MIQLAVQIHMLIYALKYSSNEDFGVDLSSILASIALAVSHILLEYVQLSYEAKACKTSMAAYCMACFNGRFGWVPFVDDFS